MLLKDCEVGKSFFLYGIMYMVAMPNHNNLEIVPREYSWADYIPCFCFHSGIIEIFHPETEINQKRTEHNEHLFVQLVNERFFNLFKEQYRMNVTQVKKTEKGPKSITVNPLYIQQ